MTSSGLLGTDAIIPSIPAPLLLDAGGAGATPDTATGGFAGLMSSLEGGTSGSAPAQAQSPPIMTGGDTQPPVALVPNSAGTLAEIVARTHRGAIPGPTASVTVPEDPSELPKPLFIRPSLSRITKDSEEAADGEVSDGSDPSESEEGVVLQTDELGNFLATLLPTPPTALLFAPEPVRFDPAPRLSGNSDEVEPLKTGVEKRLSGRTASSSPLPEGQVEIRREASAPETVMLPKSTAVGRGLAPAPEVTGDANDTAGGVAPSEEFPALERSQGKAGWKLDSQWEPVKGQELASSERTQIRSERVSASKLVGPEKDQAPRSLTQIPFEKSAPVKTVPAIVPATMFPQDISVPIGLEDLDLPASKGPSEMKAERASKAGDADTASHAALGGRKAVQEAGTDVAAKILPSIPTPDTRASSELSREEGPWLENKLPTHLIHASTRVMAADQTLPVFFRSQPVSRTEPGVSPKSENQAVTQSELRSLTIRKETKSDVGSGEKPVPAAPVEQARLARSAGEVAGNFGKATLPAEFGLKMPFPLPETADIPENTHKTEVSSPAIAGRDRVEGSRNPPLKPVGTPVAQQSVAMCFDGHQPEIAGFTPRMKADREMSAPSRSFLVETSSSSVPQPQPQPEPLMNRDSLPSSVPADVRRPLVPHMDRLAELVSVEATILRQFKPGALTAVVRPDPSSELRLELRLNRGQVEAHAVLEKGDVHAFAVGWEELQKSLRSQGIELQPLTEAANRPVAGGSDQGERRQAPGRDQDERQPGSWSLSGLPEVLKPAVAGIAARVSPATGGTRHLLESWA